MKSISTQPDRWLRRRYADERARRLRNPAIRLAESMAVNLAPFQKTLVRYLDDVRAALQDVVVPHRRTGALRSALGPDPIARVHQLAAEHQAASARAGYPWVERGPRPWPAP